MPPRLHGLHFLYLRKGLSKCYDVFYISSIESYSGIVPIKGNIITLETLKYYTDHEVCRNGFFQRNRHIKVSF